MNKSNCVLLGIRGEHAARILGGEKRAELRKSFSESARIVFLYETAPTSAVTGAFFVKRAVRTPTHEAVQLARDAGVEEERARKYFGDRRYGWVITIGLVIPFAKPFGLDRLRELNHYFAVPQGFTYLNRVEALTQELLACLSTAVSPLLRLKPMPPEKRNEFVSLVLSDVGRAYDDIDDDFIRQLEEPAPQAAGAFSTEKKHLLQAKIAEHVVGYTVLTEKVHGAWKSGPTILLPEYRGMALGNALRETIVEYCRVRKARSVYCTAADSRPEVVSYLLRAGMRLQARLRRHLSPDRDELVFSYRIAPLLRRPPPPDPVKPREVKVSVRRITSNQKECASQLQQFLGKMEFWYFVPPDALADTLGSALEKFERGDLKYSNKGRVLYAAVDSSGNGVAWALGTPKRSGMLKLNLVDTTQTPKVLMQLLRRVLRDMASFRRLYVTVPVVRTAALQALTTVGFVFEGQLEDPYGSGLDHACYGYNPQQA